MLLPSNPKPVVLHNRAEVLRFLQESKVAELPGLNIQEPWCSLILNGTKTTETRSYNCPAHYQGVLLGAVATQRAQGPLKTALMGLITIAGTKRYSDEASFAKDRTVHGITPESPYWFVPGEAKWGWLVRVEAVFAEPLKLLNRRGIVWSSQLVF